MGKKVWSLVITLLFALCLTVAVSAGEYEASYGTPTLDGRFDEAYRYSDKVSCEFGATDKSARADIYSMWDEKYVYFLFDVRDTTLDLAMNANGGSYNNYDGLFFGLNYDGATAAIEKSTSDLGYFRILENQSDLIGQGGLFDATIGKCNIVRGARASEGYIIEAAFPWSNFAAEQGKSITFAARIFDLNGATVVSNSIYTSANQTDIYKTAHGTDSSVWERLTLVANDETERCELPEHAFKEPIPVVTEPAQGPAVSAPIDSDRVGQNEYTVAFGTPKMDGRIDEAYQYSDKITCAFGAGEGMATADIYALWDNSFLYLLFDVHDTTPDMPWGENGNSYNNYDGLFLGFNFDGTTADIANSTTDVGYIRITANDAIVVGYGDFYQKVMEKNRLRRGVRNADGYVLEYAISWSRFEPEEGKSVTFAARIFDMNGADKVSTEIYTSKNQSDIYKTAYGTDSNRWEQLNLIKNDKVVRCELPESATASQTEAATLNALPTTTAPIVTKAPDFDAWEAKQSTVQTAETAPAAPESVTPSQSSAVIGGADALTDIAVTGEVNTIGVIAAIAAAVVLAVGTVILLVLKNKRSK